MHKVNTRFLDHDYRNYYIPDYSILFFTNHKAAVSSLKWYAFTMYGQSSGYDLNYGKRAPKLPYNLMKSSPDIFKVMIARNPWDRLVSCYEQKKRDNKIEFFNSIDLDISSSFDSFARKVCRIPDHYSDRHFRSQFTHITWFDGSLLVDYIIRFSHLEKDLDFLVKLKDLPLIPFSHLNKSHNEDYTSYYDPELVELVAERYKVDIELFGFKFAESLQTRINLTNDKPLSPENQLAVLEYKSMRSQYYLAYMNQKTWPKSKSIKTRFRYLLKGEDP